MTTLRRFNSERRQRPWLAARREAVLLLLVAVVLAAVAWAVRPGRLPLRADARTYELDIPVPLLDVEAALALYDEGVHLFVDTRPTILQGQMTIPGSLDVRSATFDDDMLAVFDFVMPEDPLILFGDGDLATAANVAARLEERGFGDVQILRGGLAAWRTAGGEVSLRRTGGQP